MLQPSVSRERQEGVKPLLCGTLMETWLKQSSRTFVVDRVSESKLYSLCMLTKLRIDVSQA
jgi:hypothetical protein